MTQPVSNVDLHVQIEKIGSEVNRVDSGHKILARDVKEVLERQRSLEKKLEIDAERMTLFTKSFHEFMVANTALVEKVGEMAVKVTELANTVKNVGSEVTSTVHNVTRPLMDTARGKGQVDRVGHIITVASLSVALILITVAYSRQEFRASGYGSEFEIGGGRGGTTPRRLPADSQAP